jgi:hypothetical protein
MMIQGGNRQLRQYFERLRIENSPIDILYKTKAAAHYRLKLKERVSSIFAGDLSLALKKSPIEPMEQLISSEPEENQKSSSVFNVSFPVGQMGMTLTKHSSGFAYVTRVVDGGIASIRGVCVDDLVIGLAGKKVNSYEEVMELIPFLPRPLKISFSRNSTSLVKLLKKKERFKDQKPSKGLLFLNGESIDSPVDLDAENATCSPTSTASSVSSKFSPEHSSMFKTKIKQKKKKKKNIALVRSNSTDSEDSFSISSRSVRSQHVSQGHSIKALSSVLEVDESALSPIVSKSFPDNFISSSLHPKPSIIATGSSFDSSLLHGVDYLASSVNNQKGHNISHVFSPVISPKSTSPRNSALFLEDALESLTLSSSVKSSSSTTTTSNGLRTHNDMSDGVRAFSIIDDISAHLDNAKNDDVDDAQPLVYSAADTVLEIDKFLNSSDFKTTSNERDNAVVVSKLKASNINSNISINEALDIMVNGDVDDDQSDEIEDSLEPVIDNK